VHGHGVASSPVVAMNAGRVTEGAGTESFGVVRIFNLVQAKFEKVLCALLCIWRLSIVISP
jgi:hypothetical protein